MKYGSFKYGNAKYGLSSNVVRNLIADIGKVGVLAARQGFGDRQAAAYIGRIDGKSTWTSGGVRAVVVSVEKISTAAIRKGKGNRTGRADISNVDLQARRQSLGNRVKNIDFDMSIDVDSVGRVYRQFIAAVTLQVDLKRKLPSIRVGIETAERNMKIITAERNPIIRTHERIPIISTRERIPNIEVVD